MRKSRPWRNWQLLLPPKNTGSALSCFSASLEERQLILTMSGVGKVNAALAAGFLLKRFQPELIISAGVCGSLTGKLGIGQTVLATGGGITTICR